MKIIKNIGLLISLLGFAIFTISIFTGSNNVSKETFNAWAKQKVKSEFFIKKAQTEIVNKELTSAELSSKIYQLVKESNTYYKSKKEKLETDF